MNKLQLTSAALFIGAAMFSMTPAFADDVAAEATTAAPTMKCVDKNNNDILQDNKVIMDDSDASKEACAKSEGHFVDAATAPGDKPVDASTEAPKE